MHILLTHACPFRHSSSEVHPVGVVGVVEVVFVCTHVPFKQINPTPQSLFEVHAVGIAGVVVGVVCTHVPFEQKKPSSHSLSKVHSGVVGGVVGCVVGGVDGVVELFSTHEPFKQKKPLLHSKVELQLSNVQSLFTQTWLVPFPLIGQSLSASQTVLQSGGWICWLQGMQRQETHTSPLKHWPLLLQSHVLTHLPLFPHCCPIGHSSSSRQLPQWFCLHTRPP